MKWLLGPGLTRGLVFADHWFRPQGLQVPVREEFATGPCKTKAKLLEKLRILFDDLNSVFLSAKHPTVDLELRFTIPRLFEPLRQCKNINFFFNRSTFFRPKIPRNKNFIEVFFHKHTKSFLELRFLFWKQFYDA